MQHNRHPVDPSVDQPQVELALANSPEKVRFKYFQRLKCDLEGFLTVWQGTLDILRIPRSVVNISQRCLLSHDMVSHCWHRWRRPSIVATQRAFGLLIDGLECCVITATFTNRGVNCARAYTRGAAYLEKTYIQVSTINVINSVKYLPDDISCEGTCGNLLHVELISVHELTISQ